MKLRRIIFVVFFTVFVGQLFCQDYFRSAYYTQSYRYRHLMNPAFQPERGYIGVPILGYFSTNFSSNVAIRNMLSAFYDNSGSKWDECIHSSALKSALKPQNKFDVNADVSIFNAGFFAWGGFNTIGYTMRSDMRGYFPKELVDLLSKSPTEGKDIHLSDLKMQGRIYSELALGHSRNINEKFSIGVKVKLLLGLLNVDANVDAMDFKAKDGYWDVRGQGVMNVSGCFDIPISNRYLSDITLSDISVNFDHLISGVGFATDLGLNYDITDEWQVNMALLNLGFMKWNKSYRSVLDVNEWQFEGFDNIKNASDEEDLTEFASSLWNSAKQCFKFKGVEEHQTKEMLSMTLNLGVQYTLPVYDKLKFGFLSTSKFNAGYSWFEGRLSANVAPIHWFDGSLSFGVSSLGSSIGIATDFHPSDFSIMIGTNLPLHSHLPLFDSSQKIFGDFYFGFNFPIGEKKKDTKVIEVESYYETDSSKEVMQDIQDMETEPRDILIEE